MRLSSVVITGLGVFSAAGKSAAQFGEALVSGKSAIEQLELFDTSGFPSHIGAEVKGYAPLDYFDRKIAAKLSRTDQFGVIAAGEALAESAVREHYSPYDIGICMGGGAAGMLQAEQWLRGIINNEKPHPTLLRGVLPDRTSGDIARIYGLGGYQGTITTACSSSATAIGWGSALIASGQQRAVLAGGADSLSLLTYAGFNSLKVVDAEPCSPFSLGRQGISLGEGAAFMVLEDRSAAIARGAKIYGAILGYALAGEAFHMTAPEPTATVPARVMNDALAYSAVNPAEVGWVNAHGTGTPLNDVIESNAMKLVFGDNAINVPLISTKPVTGHCLGSAGAIEAVATVIALNRQIIPQTLNYRGRDPDCDLDYCHNGCRKSDATVAMSNSFAFGGNITSLVISR